MAKMNAAAASRSLNTRQPYRGGTLHRVIGRTTPWLSIRNAPASAPRHSRLQPSNFSLRESEACSPEPITSAIVSPGCSSLVSVNDRVTPDFERRQALRAILDAAISLEIGVGQRRIDFE